MPASLRQPTKRERELVGEYAVRHGMVRGLDLPISDDDGGIGMPLLRLSTLARLELRGRITPEMRAAGDTFNALFQRAGLDGLKAADLARVPGGVAAGDIPASHERCRARVAAAIRALGGNGSIAASVIWHCAGLEWSVRKWAQTTRRPPQLACGILVASLGVLAAHFAGGRR